MPKVSVRRVNEWDGPAMLKIYGPFVGTCHAPEQEIPELQSYIQRIDRYTYGLGWLLCEIDSTPAGFCHLSEDRADPQNLFSVEFQLYVKPEFQGIGVGKALWTLMRDMMELGSRRQVFARLSPENKEGEGFLRAMGFEDFAREEGELVLRCGLAPRNPAADRPVKPYLLENVDYERAREQAALLVNTERLPGKSGEK